VTTTMPQPALDPWNRPFWKACSEGRLILQRCRQTKEVWYPPSPVSPYQPDAGWDWIDSSGQGVILSWVVFHQRYFAGFADRIPYNVAMVRLDEGAVLISNIDAPNDEIRIGRRVSVKFERRAEVDVPIFTWADGE
jgi:uncharacterized OB-fold protein